MDLAVHETVDLQSGSYKGRFELACVGIRAVSSISADSAVIGKWRCGRIVTHQGRLIEIRGRWWPYQGSWARAIWDAQQRPLRQDRCELYYHQPWNSPDFLSLAYVRSGPETTLSTFYLATLALDQIAELKGSSAIVCHVTNDRISDRLLARWGWQQHCLNWSGRHFIKRFYGKYPPLASIWRKRLEPAKSITGNNRTLA